MQKSLYSLILSDSVISKIDMLALKQGTNRSNMINMILADYVSLTTPEMHIENVFRQMEQMLSVYDNIVPIMIPNRATMSVKSTLEYKYRPTVKYEIYKTVHSVSCLCHSARSRSRLSRLRRSFSNFGADSKMRIYKEPLKMIYGTIIQTVNSCAR